MSEKCISAYKTGPDGDEICVQVIIPERSIDKVMWINRAEARQLRHELELVEIQMAGRAAA